MTSAQPSPPDSALTAALSSEHAVIYGYGIVSAHCAPEVNNLVSFALTEHRHRRDQAIAMLSERSASAPVAAAGYQLPMPVDSPTDAVQLAVRMEKDTEVAWRAVLEQAQRADDRKFGVDALTQSAVLSARWKQVQGTSPVTTAFPGAD